MLFDFQIDQSVVISALGTAVSWMCHFLLRKNWNQKKKGNWQIVCNRTARVKHCQREQRVSSVKHAAHLNKVSFCSLIKPLKEPQSCSITLLCKDHKVGQEIFLKVNLVPVFCVLAALSAVQPCCVWEVKCPQQDKTGQQRWPQTVNYN